MKRGKAKPKYANWVKKSVKLADLFLDPDNIRLQVSVKPSQITLLNDLFANENAMQILESIANNGVFPDEMPVVVKNEKKYTVIDGNRRVAALKEMLRPRLLPNKEKEVKEMLKNAGPVPAEITVVVAPDRQSAHQLLASKHTQNTRRRWHSLRQAHFYKAELDRGRTVKQLKADYPGVDIDKFLRYISIHRIAKGISYVDTRVGEKVQRERSFPITTVERLYDDKQVRNFLGFEFDKDGEVKIRIAKSEFEKGFHQIIQDIVLKNVDSRKLNNEGDRRNYLKNFPKSSIPKQRKGTKTITSKAFKEKPVVKSTTRRKLAPPDMIMTLKSPGVKRMLEELQGLNCKEYSNAAHDLLRSFLECSLKVYLKHIDNEPIRKGDEYITLDRVLGKFEKHLKGEKEKGLLQVTRKIISDNTMKSYSAQSLNATNHNPDVFATHEEVVEAWDKMEPLFRYILSPSTE